MNIDKCQFCGSTNLAVGYQLGQGEMLSDYYGSVGCKIIHVICKDCASIIHSRVEKTDIFDDDNRL